MSRDDYPTYNGPLEYLWYFRSTANLWLLNPYILLLASLLNSLKGALRVLQDRTHWPNPLRASVHSSVHSCLCGFFFLHKAIKLLSEMHDVFQIPEMRPRLLLALDISVEMVIVLVIRTVWPLLAILLLDTLAW